MRKWVARISQVIYGKSLEGYYDQGCDSNLCILAWLLMEMWWRKKGKRIFIFVGDPFSYLF